MASTVIGGRKYECPVGDGTHLKDIVGGKSDFAEVIVPTFAPVAFDAFEAVFAVIEATIEHNRQER